jgi:hypothetical protein
MGRLTNLNPSKPLTESDIPPEIATDTELSNAIAAHLASSDPHNQYRLRGVAQLFNEATKCISFSIGGINSPTAASTNRCGLEVRNSEDGGAAFMSFQRVGVFGLQFGIDNNNRLAVGGWNLGNNSYAIFHEGLPLVVKTALPTGNSGFGTGYNAVTGASEVCSYSGSGTGSVAYNFYRVPGVAGGTPSSSNRISWIDSAGGYFQSSDFRSKRNFKNSPGLTEILKIRPLCYDHFEVEKDGALGLFSTPRIGLIAQEVKQVIPQAVSQNEEFYGIDYSCLVACLVQAVKDLKFELDEIKRTRQANV